MSAEAGSRDRWAEAIADEFAGLAGPLASVERDVKAGGVAWIAMVPRNVHAAPVEVRIDGPNVHLVIGESGNFEFPYWSGKRTFDDGCLHDLVRLTQAVVRGEVVEWSDTEDFGDSKSSGMSIGVGTETVVTGRRSVWKLPLRRRAIYKRHYESYS